ncbi:MAG: hypothetical protein M3Q61_07605 [Chloroflexota bacterium]|nr:hypothetical protein [Chloroflexota bacterium]
MTPKIAVRISGGTSAGYTKVVRLLLVLLVGLIIVSLLLPMVLALAQ